jgi:hypothetical protein
MITITPELIRSARTHPQKFATKSTTFTPLTETQKKLEALQAMSLLPLSGPLARLGSLHQTYISPSSLLPPSVPEMPGSGSGSSVLKFEPLSINYKANSQDSDSDDEPEMPGSGSSVLQFEFVSIKSKSSSRDPFFDDTPNPLKLAGGTVNASSVPKTHGSGDSALRIESASPKAMASSRDSLFDGTPSPLKLAGVEMNVNENDFNT